MSALSPYRLATLRQTISATAGTPVILAAQPDLPRRDFLPETDRTSPSRACGVVWVDEVGACAFGRSSAEAAWVARAYRSAAASDTGASEFERQVATQATTSEPAGVFAGEVALVTGAASGIGRACVESFLARGAAVAGLDINPRIVGMLDRPDFLGLRCDLTDEAAVDQALEKLVYAFGGLDMLVVNAGVFPAGCDISMLKLAEWQRVMRINLDAGLTMLREAYPLLKVAPKHGRVAVNGSRNVPAPGPGAAAYSCSKAALTQLARVAALEWAKDGIRVNIFHAHAVFDTGIWTDEVLRARASHYGMTVEQYKKNNLLKAEIVSRDVAELAAEMCGPVFAKTTGAQVPIDGGSDRVV
jgi:NAD(P)-dependent dehydrogenase (short-subunit alcohol dehydrogenase family)